MTKNLGAGVSGYLVPDGRAWESVTYIAGKPVLDRELMLMQDISQSGSQGSVRAVMPSGWLSSDFLATSESTSAVFTANATANLLQMPNLRAHVNGWLIPVQHTNASGRNQLVLPAGPTGAGSQRTDLIFLEVFRRLVPGSGTEGKSQSGRIWQNGNVKTPADADTTLNFVDDLYDVNVGQETSRRVQIQYRLRAVTGIDVFAYPAGLDDPIVAAHSVPANAGAPNGTATTFTYVNQSSAGDPGLWVAGDGIPSNALGTVDGYMYAIPLVAVFRRNTAPFSRLTNQNGGVAAPGPSDRPDGFLHDIFAADDILDLRHGVSPTGWSYGELLEKTTNAVFDNQLRTEIINANQYGGGQSGTTVLRVDEIGVLPGNGTTTGQTSAGPLIGQFDGVRRRFSDRMVLETVTIRHDPSSGSGYWVNGRNVTILLEALAIYPYTATNWSASAPGGARIVDVLDMRWAGSAPPLKTIEATPYLQYMTGLGAVPRTSLGLNFGAITALGLTTEPLYITLLVCYPVGGGLSHTPTQWFSPKSFEVTTPAALSTAAPMSFSQFEGQFIDPVHREVQIQYVTSTSPGLTVTMASLSLGSGVATKAMLPERARSLISARVNGTTVSATLSTSGREVTFPSAVAVDQWQTLSVTYAAVRAVPKAGVQMAIHYRSAAPQMVRRELATGSLPLLPRLSGPYLYALTVGSGSPDEGYPFPLAYVQTGGVFPSSAGVALYDGEASMSAPASVSVADFNANTGFLRLPVYVPMVSSPEGFVLSRALSDVDIEGRAYFPSAGSGYVPNAYGQNLSTSMRHKNVYPILAELTSDSGIGRRGQLVLVLLIRYASNDVINGVYFGASAATNTTTAAVFRVKGHLLNARN